MWRNKEEAYRAGKRLLEEQGWQVEDYQDINYGLQFAAMRNGKQVRLRVYESKKGVRYDFSPIKKPELAAEIQGLFGGAPGVAVPKAGSATATPPDPDELIGVDESGKGDYFGPLVIAGAYVNAELAYKLRALGVQDSKTLSDSAIAAMARRIKELCPHSIVRIGNERYNQLYAKIANLNKLLAWGHARIIENMLEQVECPLVLSDKFGNEALIQNALLDKGRGIRLLQRTKAESNIAVAAASILARDAFVRALYGMQQEFGMTFPKGASAATLSAAKSFARKYGREALAKVAKLHFKTTLRV